MKYSLNAKILKASKDLAYAVVCLAEEPNVTIDVQVSFFSYIAGGPVYKSIYIVVSDDLIGLQAEICAPLETWIPGADMFLNDFLSNPTAQASLLKTIVMSIEKVRVFKKLEIAKAKRTS